MGLKALSTILLVSISTAMAAPSSGAEPQLVVIHSYAPNDWTKAVREGFFSNPTIHGLTRREYYFDSNYWMKRGPLSTANDTNLGEFLKTIRSEDFVVISDDEAATLVLPKLSHVQKILLIGINGSSASKNWDVFCSTSNARAILFEEYPYRKALDFAKKHFPSIDQITAIGGASETTHRMIQGLRDSLEGTKLKVSDSIEAREWAVWREKLKVWSSPKNLVLYFVPFGLRDAMNEEIAPPLVSKWISENTKSIGVGAFALGPGMDVTVGLSGMDLGREAGGIAESILKNRNGKCRYPTQYYKINQGGRKR